MLLPQVHADGIITLGKQTFSQATQRHRQFPFPPNVPSIAVFYAPIEVKDASEVLYRETRNASIVKKATDQVRASFIKEKDFLATSVFIATWKNVAHADGRFPNKVKLHPKIALRTIKFANTTSEQADYLSGERRVLASEPTITTPSPTPLFDD